MSFKAWEQKENVIILKHTNKMKTTHLRFLR